MGEVFSCGENNFTIFQLLDSIMWVFGDVWKNQYICKKWKIENVPNKKYQWKISVEKISQNFLSPPSCLDPIFGYSRITLTRASPCRPRTGGLGFTIGGNARSA